MMPPNSSVKINSQQLLIGRIKPAGPIIPERITKKACTRTPLSNITNTPLSNITSIPSGTKVQQKRDKRKGKAVHNDWENIPLNDWSRNLFDEEFSKKPNTAPHLYDDKGCIYFQNCSMNIIFVCYSM